MGRRRHSITRIILIHHEYSTCVWSLLRNYWQNTVWKISRFTFFQEMLLNLTRGVWEFEPKVWFNLTWWALECRSGVGSIPKLSCLDSPNRLDTIPKLSKLGDSSLRSLSVFCCRRFHRLCSYDHKAPLLLHGRAQSYDPRGWHHNATVVVVVCLLS